MVGLMLDLLVKGTIIPQLSRRTILVNNKIFVEKIKTYNQIAVPNVLFCFIFLLFGIIVWLGTVLLSVFLIHCSCINSAEAVHIP